MSHRETNPHFSRPLRPQHGDHMQPPPVSVVPPPPPQPSQPSLGLPQGPSPPYRPSRPRRGKIDKPPPPPPPVKQPQVQGEPSPPYRPYQPPRGKTEGPPPKTRPTPPPLLPSSPSDEPLSRPTPQPPPRPHRHDRRGHPHGGFRVPAQKRTKPHTWLFAVFCVIFWLVIIIGGLIVLIVYLVFRPQSPHFEVSSATLNAAYLDVGYLLNADVTVLANFTNPNKRVHVDFSSVTIYLSYGSTVIAAQYVEPFSAAKKESRFANVHLVTSQVQLPMAETQRLIKQMESNGVILEVKGVFRARSKLGSILRYSYNLYGYCSIMLARPPGGVLIKRKCRTKR